jgi:hypothetical protein
MRIFSAYLITAFLFAGCALAANDAGTESPFSMGAGARELSLGGAGVAICDMNTAIFWNPSRLAQAEHISIGGFYSRLYDSDVAYQYLGFSYPTLDFGSFGLGIFHLGVNDIEKRDESNLLLGHIQDERLGFYLAYGRSISGYNLGLALNMEHHSLDAYSTTSSPGLCLSISRQYSPRIDWLRQYSIALNGQNLIKLSSKLADESVSYPLSADLGFAVTLLPKPGWNQSLTLTGRIKKTDKISAAPAAGIEYGFYDCCFLRCGLQENKFSAGAGIKYKFIGIDYAYVSRDLGSLHMFNLTMNFGTPISFKKKHREAKREKEFNSLMRNQMLAHYNKMVNELLHDGKSFYNSGDLIQAEGYFDRALFLARINDIDTAEISQLAMQTKARLNEITRRRLFQQHSDSARAKLEKKDYIGARYYADLALTQYPDSREISDLLKQIDDNIRKISSREQMIKGNLLTIDSLLSYGDLDEAFIKAQSIRQFAGDDIRVKAIFKKVRFERFRESAFQAYNRLEFETALVDVDSALALYTQHQACLNLRDRIASRLQEEPTVAAKADKSGSIQLTEALQKEIDDLYKSGQKAFENGELYQAIAGWEKVEGLVPGYGSVRGYLVNAYRYVGVELYSRNQYKQAIEIWEKARRLDPGNNEINEFIKRTQNEMEKLYELSKESK